MPVKIILNKSIKFVKCYLIISLWLIIINFCFVGFAQATSIIVRVTQPTGPAPLEVEFKATDSRDPDGSVETYKWDYGDGGQAVGSVVKHTYENGGQFTVRLTVTDSAGDSFSTTVDISVPERQIPFAAFSFSLGNQSLSILFDAKHSKAKQPIVTYEWDFGDGSPILVCNNRAMAIGLPVTQPSESGESGTIIVSPGGTMLPPTTPPPASNILPSTTPSIARSLIPESLVFEHIYAAPGLYAVRLKVTDEAGASHNVTRSIKVLRNIPISKDLIDLPGVTGGTPSSTSVAVAKLSNLGIHRIGSLLIKNREATQEQWKSVPPAPFAGFKLDAIIYSTAFCLTAPCAAFLIQDSNYASWNASILPGFDKSPDLMLEAGVDSDIINKPTFFGVTSNGVDDTIATLDILDANASRVNPHGFLTLGYGGALLLRYPTQNETGVDMPAIQDLYLYIGLIKEENSEVYINIFEDIVSWEDVIDTQYTNVPSNANQLGTVAKTEVKTAALFSPIPGLQGSIPVDFGGCSFANYQAEAGAAFIEYTSAANVHLKWYQQCLITRLYRGQYLDPWLNDGLKGYADWQTSIMLTGDEMILQPETEAALDYLGKGLSNAVDRANNKCTDANEWRLAEAAIQWWRVAQAWGLDTITYRLDNDNFLDRLCVKMYLDMNYPTEGAVLGLNKYCFDYRAGIQVGDHPAQFDVPVDQVLSIEGGTITDQLNYDDMSAEDLAAIEAMIEDPAVLAIYKNSIKGLHSVSVQPENNDYGLRIKVNGNIKELPIVTMQKIVQIRQNPYHHSTWAFDFSRSTEYLKYFVHILYEVGNENGGSEFQQIKGNFQLIWAPPSENKGMVLEFSGVSGSFQWIENPDYWCTGHQGGPVSEIIAKTSGSVSANYCTELPENALCDLAYQASPGVPLTSLFIEDNVPYMSTYYTLTCRDPDDPSSTWEEWRIACDRDMSVLNLPLEDGYFTSEFSSENETTKYQYNLVCTSDCPVPITDEPSDVVVPEPEVDKCSESWLTNTCEQDKRNVILFCSQLKDWQVVVDWSDARGKELFCETIDCAANSSHSTAATERTPFTAITHATDSTCSNGGTRTCTIDCIGF